MIINNNELFCSFIQIEDYVYECMKCGVRLVIQDNSDQPPLLPCSAPISNYSASGIKSFMGDYVNSEELCSEEEIDKRHNICSGCEFFTNNSCMKCGCSLSRDRIYMNKLAMKDQSCPINKW
jgi:hypothetical protein